MVIRLDFKAIQYSREKHSDLLKDLIAFANADIEGDRFIIIGVMNDETKEKVFKGIKKEEFVDSAIYHQLIRDNVEPDINFDYFLHSYLGKDFAIFRIFDCSNKPYLMKKDNGSLRKGDGWIRKGTHQPRLIRRDFDAIYEKIKEVQGFSGEIRCFFSDSSSEGMDIQHLDEFKLPSDLAAENIRELINERDKYIKASNENKTLPWVQAITPLVSPNGRFFSIRGLEADLENVKEDYFDDDRYAIFEQHGNFINISILNLGDKYIEDASIRVIFPKIEGLEIAEKIYMPTDRSFNSMTSSAQVFINVGYPSVKYFDDIIEIKTNLKNIKHHIPMSEVFDKPIRIIVRKNLKGQTIPVKCVIYGKNLQKPIEKELKMHIKATL